MWKPAWSRTISPPLAGCCYCEAVTSSVQLQCTIDKWDLGYIPPYPCSPPGTAMLCGWLHATAAVRSSPPGKRMFTYSFAPSCFKFHRRCLNGSITRRKESPKQYLWYNSGVAVCACVSLCMHDCMPLHGVYVCFLKWSIYHWNVWLMEDPIIDDNMLHPSTLGEDIG